MRGVRRADFSVYSALTAVWQSWVTKRDLSRFCAPLRRCADILSPRVRWHAAVLAAARDQILRLSRRCGDIEPSAPNFDRIWRVVLVLAKKFADNLSALAGRKVTIPIRFG